MLNGEPVKKRKAVKLADSRWEYQTEKSVEGLAQKHLLPLNLGTHRSESTDTLGTFLQAFNVAPEMVEKDFKRAYQKV